MTSSLLFAGSSTYRLIHDGLDVGWLVGDTLVFTGFQSLAEARARRRCGPCRAARLVGRHERGRGRRENENTYLTIRRT